MRDLKWVRGKTAKVLAAQWKLSLDTVEGMSAEASRRVRAEVVDPDAVTETVAIALDKTLRGALRAKHPDRRAVVSAADVWTRIVGARAPEKHKVDLSVQQYEALPPAAMLARLDDQIAKLTEARAKLVAEHQELEGSTTVTLSGPRNHAGANTKPDAADGQTLPSLPAEPEGAASVGEQRANYAATLRADPWCPRDFGGELLDIVREADLTQVPEPDCQSGSPLLHIFEGVENMPGLWHCKRCGLVKRGEKP